jgi:peptidyl-tRNA hydrolase, PTH1 family
MSPATSPLFIIGLGNPGPRHAGDRHNVGFWLADQLASHMGTRFSADSKMLGETASGTLAGRAVRLLKPATFMNRSGQSMRRFLDYYQGDPAEALVLHDELDLPPGTARLKRGGGHGGHNGLRDAITHCGADFLRLRVGIGHPGHKDLVTDYVLNGPGSAERTLILDALDAALDAVETLAASSLEQATQQLHTAAPRNGGDFGPAG